MKFFAALAAAIAPLSSVPGALGGTLDDEVFCGCSGCDSAAFDVWAGDHKCGDRIAWLRDAESYSERDACAQVAGEEFPAECGACDPDTCDPPPPPCGCPECDDVWDAMAGDYPCGSRIEWLRTALFYEEPDACAQVASDEFPVECGKCDPATCNNNDDDDDDDGAAPTEEEEEEQDEGDGDVFGGCCSQNYRDCDAHWCGESKNECDSCAGNELIYLEDGANTSGCEARWSTCTSDPNACCPGLECKVISAWYSQCLPGNGGVGDEEPDADTDAPADDEEEDDDSADLPSEEEEGGGEESPDDDDSSCEDNPDPFFYKGKTVTCSSIAAVGEQKRKRKCREGRRLIEECPSVCDEELCGTSSPTVSPTDGREPCENNPGEFEFKGKITTCAAIAALGPQKFRRKCLEGRRVEIECPGVCLEECTE